MNRLFGNPAGEGDPPGRGNGIGRDEGLRGPNAYLEEPLISLSDEGLRPRLWDNGNGAREASSPLLDLSEEDLQSELSALRGEKGKGTRANRKGIMDTMKKLALGIETSHDGESVPGWERLKDRLVGAKWEDEVLLDECWTDLKTEHDRVLAEWGRLGRTRGRLMINNLTKVVEILAYYWREKGQDPVADDLKFQETEMMIELRNLESNVALDPIAPPEVRDLRDQLHRERTRVETELRRKEDEMQELQRREAARRRELEERIQREAQEKIDEERRRSRRWTRGHAAVIEELLRNQGHIEEQAKFRESLARENPPGQGLLNSTTVPPGRETQRLVPEFSDVPRRTQFREPVEVPSARVGTPVPEDEYETRSEAGMTTEDEEMWWDGVTPGRSRLPRVGNRRESRRTRRSGVSRRGESPLRSDYGAGERLPQPPTVNLTRASGRELPRESPWELPRPRVSAEVGETWVGNRSGRVNPDPGPRERQPPVVDLTRDSRHDGFYQGRTPPTMYQHRAEVPPSVYGQYDQGQQSSRAHNQGPYGNQTPLPDRTMAGATMAQILQASANEFFQRLPPPYNVAPMSHAPSQSELRKMVKDNPLKDVPAEYPRWRQWFLQSVHLTHLPVSSKCDTICRCLEGNKKLAILRSQASFDEEGYRELLEALEQEYGDRRNIQADVVKQLRSFKVVKYDDADQIKSLSYLLGGLIRSGPEMETQAHFGRAFNLLANDLRNECRRWIHQARKPADLPTLRAFLNDHVRSLDLDRYTLDFDDRSNTHRAHKVVTFEGDEGNPLPEKETIPPNIGEIIRTEVQRGIASGMTSRAHHMGSPPPSDPIIPTIPPTQTLTKPSGGPLPGPEAGQGGKPQFRKGRPTGNPPKLTAHELLDRAKRNQRQKPYVCIKENHCPDCDVTHKLRECPVYLALDPKDRDVVVSGKGLCYKCLGYGHMAKDCKEVGQCFECGDPRHHTTLHGARPWHKAKYVPPSPPDPKIPRPPGGGCEQDGTGTQLQRQRRRGPSTRCDG